MITTSLDVLYIAIAISVLLLAIFVCVNLIYTILILRDVTKATEKIKDAAEQINEYIVKPVKMASGMIENIGTVITLLTERFGDKGKK
ncbi:hypothetical protein KKG71_03340 [Patescibacteria group bacterium]|nr:hypothetical protein [Patescibacteria group bacterium]